MLEQSSARALCVIPQLHVNGHDFTLEQLPARVSVWIDLVGPSE